MVRALKNLAVLLKSSDLFLVVELLADFSRLTLLESKNHGHTLTVLRTEKIKSASYDQMIENLRRTFRRFPQWGKYPIVITLDSRFASTIDSLASIIRKEPNLPITEADLDNLISQGIWKVASRDQSRVAKKLNTAELNVSLASSGVARVRLDQHRVASPMGFTARTLEFSLQHTYVLKKLFDDLRAIFPEDRIILIEEAGASWLRLLSKKTHTVPLLLIALGQRETTLYIKEEASLKFLDRVQWGGDHVLILLEQTLLVAREVAERILDRYLKQEMSAALLKKLDVLLSGQWAIFLQAIKAHYPRRTPTVYAVPFFPLPENATSAAMLKKLGISGTFFKVTDAWAGEQFHCELVYKGSLPLAPTFPLIAAGVQFYSAATDDIMNKIAKRRARWLAASLE